MNLIGVIVGALGLLGMFLSAFTGMAAMLSISTFAMYAGVALIAFSRAMNSGAIVKMMIDEGATPPLSSKIGQIFWSLLGLLLIAQALSELVGTPLIEF